MGGAVQKLSLILHKKDSAGEQLLHQQQPGVVHDDVGAYISFNATFCGCEKFAPKFEPIGSTVRPTPATSRSACDNIITYKAAISGSETSNGTQDSSSAGHDIRASSLDEAKTGHGQHAGGIMKLTPAGQSYKTKPHVRGDISERKFATTDPMQVIHIRAMLIEIECAKFAEGKILADSLLQDIKSLAEQVLVFHKGSLKTKFVLRIVSRVFQAAPNHPIFVTKRNELTNLDGRSLASDPGVVFPY